MPVRILTLCATDATAWILLTPGLRALKRCGYEVHVACADGQYCENLRREGFTVHTIGFRRTFAPWANLKPLLQLWALIRRNRYDIVNTHTPVAAMVGRIAARMAGCRAIVYTVHGFYFHENTRPLWRSLFVSIEWLLGGITHHFIFVSGEDHRTAIDTGIRRGKAGAITLYNGVDAQFFSPRECEPVAARLLRQRLQIPEETPVIGIVARIVREKGYPEFLEMARRVTARRKAVFLVVGDTLPSDRDHFGDAFRTSVDQAGMTGWFRFTGHTDKVGDYLRVMDIFVLPSYREGFPMSVLEAMSCGLPVVASNIRGCREAVIEEETGLLVAPGSSDDLYQAVERLLRDPALASRLGRAGRQRVISEFSSDLIHARLVAYVDQICLSREAGIPQPRSAAC